MEPEELCYPQSYLRGDCALPVQDVYGEGLIHDILTHKDHTQIYTGVCESGMYPDDSKLCYQQQPMESEYKITELGLQMQQPHAEPAPPLYSDCDYYSYPPTWQAYSAPPMTVHGPEGSPVAPSSSTDFYPVTEGHPATVSAVTSASQGHQKRARTAYTSAQLVELEKEFHYSRRMKFKKESKGDEEKMTLASPVSGADCAEGLRGGGFDEQDPPAQRFDPYYSSEQRYLPQVDALYPDSATPDTSGDNDG